MRGGRVLRTVVCLMLAMVGFTTVVAGESAAPPASAPPKFDLEVFLDLNETELRPAVPGRLETRHWQGMVSTAVAMRFIKGPDGHVPTVARQYGDLHLHLISGNLDVVFQDQTLNMKSGDVASWGNQEHRILCQSDECRLLILATPVLWQELGPAEGNPVPLYLDAGYYAAHGRKQ